MKKLPNGKWQVRWRDASRRQRARNFKTKELAQAFLRKLDRGEIEKPDSSTASQAFSEIVAEWKSRRYPTIAVSSRVAYDKLLRLHFGPLMGVPLAKLTPSVIDGWIKGMVEQRPLSTKAAYRQSFKAELRLLTAILRSHAEYQDDDEYVVPIRKRHRKAVELRNRRPPKPKDPSELEFRRFLVELEKGPDGPQMVALATIQFHHALRISEAAALRWEDVQLVPANPRASRIAFRWHVVYTHNKAVDDFLEPGFKNSRDGKEHPMLPAVYHALMKVPRRPSGLVFRSPAKADQPADKQFWDYRAVQYRYDRAFGKAGLTYTSTHVMRHGGTQAALDETSGDRDVARHLLGNASQVEVYAQRSSRVLKRFADAQWEADQVSASGEDSAERGGETSFKISRIM